MLFCVFLETSTDAFISAEGKNVALSSGSSLCIFLAKALAALRALFLSWGFLKCSFLKLGRAKISLMRFTFLDNASKWPFEFRTTCVLRILWCVPPKRSTSPAFRRIDFFGSEFLRYTTSDLFFSSRFATAPWVLFFFRLLAGFLLTISVSIQTTFAITASVSRLVITTQATMSKITRRYFTSCPHRQWILALVAELAGLYTCRVFHVSLSFSRRYRRGCLPFTFSPLLVIHGRFKVRYSCVLHFFRWCLSVSRGTLQESPFWTRQICLPLKAFSCLGEGILSLSFSYGHTLCNLVLNPEISTSLSLFKMRFHTNSVCHNLVFLLLTGWKVLQMSELGRNFEPWRRTDLQNFVRWRITCQ